MIAKGYSKAVAASVASGQADIRCGSNKEIFVDGYISDKLKTQGIVDENGDYSEKYINKIKNEIAEEHSYDLNNPKDRSEVAYMINNRIEQQAKNLEKEAMVLVEKAREVGKEELIKSNESRHNKRRKMQQRKKTIIKNANFTYEYFWNQSIYSNQGYTYHDSDYVGSINPLVCLYSGY